MSDESSPKGPGLQKQSTRFGKLLTSVEKATKSATKTISHARVKAKQYSASKMGVEATTELPEVAQAFETLRVAKIEITALAMSCRAMYEARTEFARQNLTFSETAAQMKFDNQDHFGIFTKQLGEVMLSIDGGEQEFLSQLVNNLVVPLEKFRDEDIEAISVLKWKYTNIKTEYDVTASNMVKADKPDVSLEKMQEAKSKKDMKELELNKAREEFTRAVQAMEEKKNTELLLCVQRFYDSLVGYSKQVVNIMAQNPVNFKPVDKSLISDLHASNPPENTLDYLRRESVGLDLGDDTKEKEKAEAETATATEEEPKPIEEIINGGVIVNEDNKEKDYHFSSYETQQPVSYETQQPVSYETQQSVSYGTQEPVSYGTQEPVYYGNAQPPQPYQSSASDNSYL